MAVFCYAEIMKLTILGSGTCASQIPNVPNRYPPAFLVEFGQEKVLFDCSEGVRFRLEQAGFQYADIHHIAISHIHPDHFALVHFIQSVFCNGLWGGIMNTNITVYCPEEIKNAYPKLLSLQIPGLDHPGLVDFPKPKFIVAADRISKLGDSTITAKKVYHEFGLTDAIAFRLETPEGVFAYSGDTGDCSGIREACKDADIFVCEASARIGDETNPTGYGHLNPRLAGEIAMQGKVKKLILFHYTGLDDDQSIIEDCKKSGFDGELVIAKDFQIFEI